MTNGYADITDVAIKYDGVIYSLPRPNRHHHVIRLIASINGVGIKGPDVQGFLDENGEFLNRQGAFIRAQRTGQIIRPKVGGYRGGDLFSEDLW
jgi:hypothetical protein